MGDISEDSPDDLEGLDAAASHVANLLSTEPADSMILLEKLFRYQLLCAYLLKLLILNIFPFPPPPQ